MYVCKVMHITIYHNNMNTFKYIQYGTYVSNSMVVLFSRFPPKVMHIAKMPCLKTIIEKNIHNENHFYGILLLHSTSNTALK